MVKRPLRKKKRNGEEGAYIVLVSVLAAVLITLGALVVGLGIFTSGKSRLQNVANLTALSAIETFLQGQNSSAFYGVRANAALNQANSILVDNKIPGLNSTLGSLQHASVGTGTSGDLEFGVWHNAQPSNGSDPCKNGKKYPCFAPNALALSTRNLDNSPVSAVRVKIKTQDSNPLVLPFLSGSASTASIETSAIASVVERCTGYLVDISGSVTSETHVKCPRRLQGNPPRCMPAPENMGLFAYRAANIKKRGDVSNPWVEDLSCEAGDPNKPGDPNNPVFWHGINEELVYWCSMQPFRGDPESKAHYRSDYALREVKVNGTIVPMYIDVYQYGSYKGPEPMGRFFLAFNAALRETQVRASSNDKAFLMAFDGEIRNRYPDPVVDGTGLTNDLNFLIQLSNLDNRGEVNSLGAETVAPVRANFLDRGWVPLVPIEQNSSQGATNILLALHTAIDTMRQNCPTRSRKNIVLATDGIGSCLHDHEDPKARPCVPVTTWPQYLAFEDDLIKAGDKKSVLARLQEENIALTTMLDGGYIDPNFINVSNPNYNCSDPKMADSPSCFLNFDQARALGYGGFNGGSASLYGSTLIQDTRSRFFDFSSTAPGATAGANLDELARKNAGRAGYIFRRPNGLFGKLALDSGGVPCPLLQNPGPSAYSPSVNGGLEYLKTTKRVNGETNRWAPFNLTKSQQAVNCAKQAVGLDPFILVEEENYLH